MKESVVTFVVAVVFGFVLSRVGFGSWDQVHAMFTFGDLRLVLAFGTAVFALLIAWQVIGRLTKHRWQTRPIHPGTFVGGMAFGIGWAFAGACPATAWVQIGEGQMAAAWSIGGMFIGNWLYGAVHQRYLRWSTGSCLSE